MLQPMRTKFRKAHKGRIKGIATSGIELAYGRSRPRVARSPAT
jgi:large subunit ribosomal protein L16